MNSESNQKSGSYLDVYQKIYNTLGYGSPYISRGVYQAKYMMSELKEGDKVLCVGCGNGYEVIQYLLAGMDAYGTETHPIKGVPILEGRIINAVAPGMPFKNKEFRLVQCCEVLEHIPEEITLPFMADLMMIGEKVLFTTSTRDDPPFCTHINYHGPEWWLKRLEELRAIIHNFQFNPQMDLLYENALISRRVDKDRVLMHVSEA